MFAANIDEVFCSFHAGDVWRLFRFFFEKVVPGMTKEQYRANFPLSRTTIARAMDIAGQPALFQKKLHLFLYYLGSIISTRKVATVFSVSVSTAWEYVDSVVKVLIDMKGTFINFPGAERCQASSNAVLQSTCFRGFVGAVDGCHIPIEKSRENEHAFVNRKGFHSIVLMGVCDERLLFVDICVDWPDSVHDSRIFKNSPLGRAFTS